MSTLGSGSAATLNQPSLPLAQTNVQTFAPIELPNESRLFEAPAGIPVALFDYFYQMHPNLRDTVDFKERSWGIDPPKLSFGHWASPDTLLHAIKTDMRFMKALELSHPPDFEFVTNSSPKDLRKILGCMILSGFVVTASNYGSHSPLLLTVAYQPPDLSADITEILLMYGARSDVKMSHGKTPLMAAAREGNAASVALLLKYGAPVDSRDEHGETALDKALIGGYESIAGILLNHGASRWSQRLPPHLMTPKIQDQLTQFYEDRNNWTNPKSISTPPPAPPSTPVLPPAYTSTSTTSSPPASAPSIPQAIELPTTAISRQAIELPDTTISQREPIVRPPGPPPYDGDKNRPKNPIDLEHVPIFYTSPLPLLTARDWTGPSYFLQAVRSHQPLMDLIKAESDMLYN